MCWQCLVRTFHLSNPLFLTCQSVGVHHPAICLALLLSEGYCSQVSVVSQRFGNSLVLVAKQKSGTCVSVTMSLQWLTGTGLRENDRVWSSNSVHWVPYETWTAIISLISEKQAVAIPLLFITRQINSWQALLLLTDVKFLKAFGTEMDFFLYLQKVLNQDCRIK